MVENCKVYNNEYCKNNRITLLRVNNLKAVDELMTEINLPKSIKDFGVNEDEFKANLDILVERAFDDQCTGANPRYPLMEEIKQMYLNAYYGNKHFQEPEMPGKKK